MLVVKYIANRWNHLCIDGVNIYTTGEPTVRELLEVSQYNKSVECQENTSQTRREYVEFGSNPTRGDSRTMVTCSLELQEGPR